MSAVASPIGPDERGSDDIAYHLGELAIARDPADPRRSVPTLPDRFHRILDLGCGICQTLMSVPLPAEVVACGVDVDAASLRFGSRLSSRRLHFICARGEHLPFTDRSFDVVIARVSLPYMDIPRVLQEIARIVKPGGYVWFALHPFPIVCDALTQALRGRDVRGVFFQTYTLLNGLALHVAGRLVRFPLGRKRCESFQTVSGMTRAMRRAGFDSVQTSNDRLFVVTATRESVSDA